MSPLSGQVEEIQPFSSLAPRVSVTYDVRGSGKTVARATGSYYYGTDANQDGFVQASELAGTPTVSPAGRFNIATGALSPTGSSVARDPKLGRTREATLGVQHELRGHLAIGAEVVFRRYDRGPASYVLGTQPGGGGRVSVVAALRWLADPYRPVVREERAVLCHPARRDSTVRRDIVPDAGNVRRLPGARPHVAQVI